MAKTYVILSIITLAWVGFLACGQGELASLVAGLDFAAASYLADK